MQRIKNMKFNLHSIHYHGDERRSGSCQTAVTYGCMTRADWIKLRDQFELIDPIYATSIANPCLVLSRTCTKCIKTPGRVKRDSGPGKFYKCFSWGEMCWWLNCAIGDQHSAYTWKKVFFSMFLVYAAWLVVCILNLSGLCNKTAW